MIGTITKHGVITGYAKVGKRIYMVWVQGKIEELVYTGKQLKCFLEQNSL